MNKELLPVEQSKSENEISDSFFNLGNQVRLYKYSVIFLAVVFVLSGILSHSSWVKFFLVSLGY